MTRKRLTLVGAAAGAAMCAVAATKCHRGTAHDGWAKKMRRHLERMPADFPPRVMFDNLEATRANTEEILSMLRSEERTEVAGPAPA